jgi:hypothetical protein
VKWIDRIWQLSLLLALLIGMYQQAELGLSLGIVLLLLKWFVILLSKVFHHDR